MSFYYRPAFVTHSWAPAQPRSTTTHGTGYQGPVMVPNPFYGYLKPSGAISPPLVPNPYYGILNRTSKVSLVMVPNPYYGLVKNLSRPVSPDSGCPSTVSYRTPSPCYRTFDRISYFVSFASPLNAGPFFAYYDESSTSDGVEFESLESCASSTVSDSSDHCSSCSNDGMGSCSNCSTPADSATEQLKQLLGKASIPSHLVSLRSPSSRHLSSSALSKDEKETLRFLDLTNSNIDGLLEFSNEDIDDYVTLATV